MKGFCAHLTRLISPVDELITTYTGDLSEDSKMKMATSRFVNKTNIHPLINNEKQVEGKIAKAVESHSINNTLSSRSLDYPN